MEIEGDHFGMRRIGESLANWGNGDSECADKMLKNKRKKYVLTILYHTKKHMKKILKTPNKALFVFAPTSHPNPPL